MMDILDWESAEWLESVQKWTNQSLTEHGLEPIGNLERVSGWALGLILKQKTDAGFYYFKSTAFLPLFSNESQVCASLSKLLPKFVPEVLNVSQDNQWMITNDFGGSLPEDTDKTIWANAFEVFALFQIKSINHLNELKLNGCLNRPIANIPAQLNELLNNATITQCLPNEIEANRDNIILSVTKAIKALEKFQMPNTLVHGDLHIENIAISNGKYLFFDWSDSCISHPFIDGTYIFRMPEGEEKQNIVKAYLTQWIHLADFETLLKAWHQAELVCYAHQAITYGSMKKALSEAQMQTLEQAFFNAFNRLISTV
ncbi:phosphotransferase [Litorilituus lipolyticus]|uniref:Aminoglycoside phosphotransferase domain-containing protein n=1 Tax=Litorilituus lipolyticus TaxID=2491017 RepID=A0A502KPL9_9GAMM|nr:phosphotransferase [Litorilituus lipolyticus]TPH12155.1 hypothetical protein EPA86_17545 [Litorilituus lipolyticus]